MEKKKRKKLPGKAVDRQKLPTPTAEKMLSAVHDYILKASDADIEEMTRAAGLDPKAEAAWVSSVIAKALGASRLFPVSPKKAKGPLDVLAQAQKVTEAKTHEDMEKFLEEHADRLKEDNDPKLRRDLVKAAKAHVYLRGIAEVASDKAQAVMEKSRLADCDYRIEIKYKFKDMVAWSSVVTVPMPKRAPKLRPGKRGARLR